jgi:uncharacterized protein YraI
MTTKKTHLRTRIAAVFIIALMFSTLLPVLGSDICPAASAASITATGKINSSDVNLRSEANTKSSIVATLGKNTSLTIQKEIFTSRTSTSATKRWYYVTAGNKSGYVRSDLVGNISYSNTAATTTDDLNYRKGPATTFGKLGTALAGNPVTLLLPASRDGSSETWYKAVVGGEAAYVIGDYISIGTASPLAQASQADLSGKSDLARALLSTPTVGGKARVVYTFNTGNCSKLFSIKGYKNAKVPQGMAFTGSEYYILYGMAAGQSVVTYSANGKRLRASKFSFSIGHPNGITWDPQTRLCYVFKGNTKKIYTYNPATNGFGKSKVAYSSSGIAYDNATNMLYATSKTGIRAYSADGGFRHQKLFARCSHGIFHYTQDCGAGEGFIFHGISGANKKTTNYLDIYRAADNAYLGSIKVNLGEIESAVVGNDGYLQLLINTMGNNTDYVWKTPLNVRELKL